MCVRTIVDTNLLAEVTGRDPSGSFGNLHRWIVRGDGRILYTDEAGFRQEMDRAGESWRQLLFRYRQNARMELADASEVEDAKQKLDSISRKSGENDLPLLALAEAAVEQGVMSGTLAGAPVRSRPRRTYDAAPGLRTAEGESVPQRLADLSAGSDAEWKELRKKLVRFGEASGLFDEVEVRRLGGNDSDPFQIRVRKFGGTLKGPWRNLKDVGYGVSQALPILVEIMNGNPSRVFLLQQPEVHLHPQAQAALGSLFLEAAAEGRQLLVETHSDPLLDRIRMDIRDRKTTLRAEDVSLLYFEREGLGVRIHSLGFDEQGNVRGAPDSYRSFFLRETERRLEL